MDDRDQMARDLIGCFPVLDKSDATDAEATGGPTTQIWQLREAARLMRERAGKATPGPWKSTDHYPHIVFQGGEENIVATNLAGDPLADGAHIAGWHPAVALAVADWLDGDDLYCWGPAEKEFALRVARAYLGADRG